MKDVPSPQPPRYVLVTPARNEAALIERTLQAVVKQTLPPIRWVIVSDGSTDGTDELVQTYCRAYPWIELLRVETGSGRDFARKVRAFNAGYARLREIPYDFIGNLDADISFSEDHFAFLLEKFAASPGLGVAGTPYLEAGTHYDYRFASTDHVTGCCQLFRRECFEAIGGFVAVEAGGEDWIAVTTARMTGWQTRTYVDRAAVHHRHGGTATGLPRWRIWFQRGAKDYALGFHPLWEVARGAYHTTSPPFLLGSLMLFAGYGLSAATRATRSASPEVMRFNRAEQMRRLKRAIVRLPPLLRHADGGTADVSLQESLARIETWVESRDYRGYEPFDGLSSPARRLTFGNRRLEQILLQLGRQSPINLRPLLGIKPLESTKGRGYMAWGHLARFEETGEAAHRRKAVDCLEWLIRNPSPLYPEHSWGNHFDYASRAGRIAKHESTIVWTSLIGQVFLDAYEILDERRYLDVARSVCAWILRLPREETPTGTCLSYVAAHQSSIHNSNLLGAAMLARTAKYAPSSGMLDVARAAMTYSCSRQLADGAWYYGEEPTYRWIDSFHTGYNLDSIKCYIDSTGDDRFRPQLDRGFRYFKATFVEPGGRPRYYHNRAYPIDIQCAAQAIETLAKFSGDDPEASSMAVAVARWTIRNMRDPSGYFHYRRYPLGAAKIPMLHWGQATMYRALALLSLTLHREQAARLE